jgi:hypothetical protein
VLVKYGLDNYPEIMKCQGYTKKTTTSNKLGSIKKDFIKKIQGWEPIQQKYKVNETQVDKTQRKNKIKQLTKTR